MLVGPSLRIAPKQPCRVVRNADDQTNVRTKNYQVSLRHWGPGKRVAATVVFVLVIIIVIDVVAIVLMPQAVQMQSENSCLKAKALAGKASPLCVKDGTRWHG